MIVYERSDLKGNIVLAVINFSPVEYKGYRFGADKGTYTVKLASDADGFNREPVKYRAEAVPSHGFDHSIVMDIKPMSGVYMVKKNYGRGNKK